MSSGFSQEQFIVNRLLFIDFVHEVLRTTIHHKPSTATKGSL